MFQEGKGPRPQSLVGNIALLYSTPLWWLQAYSLHLTTMLYKVGPLGLQPCLRTFPLAVALLYTYPAGR